MPVGSRSRSGSNDGSRSVVRIPRGVLRYSGGGDSSAAGGTGGSVGTGGSLEDGLVFARHMDMLTTLRFVASSVSPGRSEQVEILPRLLALDLSVIESHIARLGCIHVYIHAHL